MNNVDRITSDTIYDYEMKEEIRKIKKSNLSREIKFAILDTYQRLGHELADDKEYRVLMVANSLLGLADAINEANLRNYVQKFIEVYKKEKPLREKKRKMGKEREARKYIPEKTFSEDLAKLNPKSQFAGQEILHFNSLYGELTIPHAELVFLRNLDSKKRPYPYLIGKDKRSAGEIWESIKPLILKRAYEMLEDIVQQKWDEETDYVGKLMEGTVIIAKELILPDRFKKEVEKRKEIEKRELQMSIEEAILSGQFFLELEESNMFYQKLIRILQEDGIKLSNKTVVDISMLTPAGLSYQHTIELMEIAAKELKNQGYRPVNLPELYYELFYETPGYPRARIYDLKDSSEMFVGECKLIEPQLPCGKTYKERYGEWREIWKKFEEERKRGLHKIPPKKRINTNGTVTITYTTPTPNIPCGFINGVNNCAPSWCKKHSRGKFVKRKISRGLDSSKEKYREQLNEISNFVRRLYKAFDMLEEKEDGYR